MATYFITIEHRSYAYYAIEAESEDEATDKVWDQYSIDDLDGGSNEIFTIETSEGE